MMVLIQTWQTENGGRLYQQSVALDAGHNRDIIRAWQAAHPSDIPVGDPEPYEIDGSSPLAARLRQRVLRFMTPP
jgi:hypothetical protein